MTLRVLEVMEILRVQPPAVGLVRLQLDFQHARLVVGFVARTANHSGVESFHAVDQLQEWSCISLLNLTLTSYWPGGTFATPASGTVLTTTGGSNRYPARGRPAWQSRTAQRQQ